MQEFKIWAPRAQQMRLQLEGSEPQSMQPSALDSEHRGWWKLSVPEAAAGTDYSFLIDDDPTPYPDPRSLWQPDGVHGPSRVYDQALFQWTDKHWHTHQLASGIIYELHIGTFTPGGTFDSAIPHLDHLVDLGITHIEVMPINEFAGNRGWGYDGVFLYAVFAPYGGPDGFKRFVDACHAKNLAVILDVVYNHFGPVGNYAAKFAPYLTERYHTPWGAAVNFNEGGSDEVRKFFLDNALMWLKDYHCDGLRLDATHEYIDRSAVHFMEQLSADVKRLGAMLNKQFVLIAESDLNDPKFVRSIEAHGYGMDAQWSDDFHHALFTLLWSDPGRGYYDDFGSMNDLVKSLKSAFVYDGQYSRYRHHSHGRPVEGIPAHRFIGYIQNHDQVGNRATGERLEHLVGLECSKLAIGLVLMAPFVPMLWMGEEFAASSPFLYFADHEEEEMRRLVSEGRKRDFAAFGWDESQIPDPEAPETFERSRLVWSEVHKGKHADMLRWVKDLIDLRRCTVDLNDGDLGHLKVSATEDGQALTMQRGSVRILLYVGENTRAFPLLEDEALKLCSRPEITGKDNKILLPKRTLAILIRQ